MASKLLIGGRQQVVPAYYSGQPTHLAPDHYETLDEAKRLKGSGKAVAINRGKAIMIKGPRRLRIHPRESTKKAWKVVGQTPKRGALYPGFPHYASV